VTFLRYGTTTLAEIEERVTKFGKELGVEIVCAQTNYEGMSLISISPHISLYKGKDGEYLS
jgi:3-dehydroquinate dehydratase-2